MPCVSVLEKPEEQIGGDRSLGFGKERRAFNGRIFGRNALRPLLGSRFGVFWKICGSLQIGPYLTLVNIFRGWCLGQISTFGSNLPTQLELGIMEGDE